MIQAVFVALPRRFGTFSSPKSVDIKVLLEFEARTDAEASEVSVEN